MPWSPRFFDLFGQQGFFRFEFADPFFIGRDNRRLRRVNDAIEEPLYLFFSLANPDLQLMRCSSRSGEAQVPRIHEHCARKLVQALARLEALEKRLKVAFEPITLDRLPIARAALRRAKIVRVRSPGVTFGPAGWERLIATSAKDKPSQWEVRVDAFPGRGFGGALLPFLNARVGLETDKAFMVPLTRDTFQFGTSIKPEYTTRGSISYTR